MLGLVTFGAVVGVGAMRIKNINLKGRKSLYSDQQKRDMLEEAVEHGWSATEAGKEFNVSRNAMTNWAKDLGIVLEKVRSSDCSHCGT